MRKLQHILDGQTEFGDLMARRNRELALEKRVLVALPAALAACVGVADARTEELVLVTCTTYNINDPRVIAVAEPG